jgi:sugar/nucleoside kinase (ribokinase family)
MKKGIAIAGNLIVDHVKEIDSYPEKGMLCNINNVSKSVGGCVSNTIIDMAKIDDSLELSAYGVVGEDADGKYLIDSLRKHAVNTQGVKINKQSITSFTDVMSNRNDNSRTFFHARGANATFGYDDIDYSSLNVSIFHMGYALLLDGLDGFDEEYGTVMAKTLHRVQQKGIKTSLDVVSENSDRFARVVSPSLKYCDYLIINEVEASMICNVPIREKGKIQEDSLIRICRMLIEKGVNELVVIHAPEASCAMDKRGQLTLVPSLALPEGYIKGSVGAGDAFCAGALYSLYHELSVEDTLKIGAGAAACSLSELNSTDGMKNIEHIKKMILEYSK